MEEWRSETGTRHWDTSEKGRSEVACGRTSEHGPHHYNHEYALYGPYYCPGTTRTHDLKSWPAFFRAIIAGTRTHELRRNDRDFAIGDALLLREYDPAMKAYTGAACMVRVTSITSDDAPCAVSMQGLARGFCILSVSRIRSIPDTAIDADDSR